MQITSTTVAIIGIAERFGACDAAGADLAAGAPADELERPLELEDDVDPADLATTG
jgi:hypothetical protein